MSPIDTALHTIASMSIPDDDKQKLSQLILLLYTQMDKVEKQVINHAVTHKLNSLK